MAISGYSSYRNQRRKALFYYGVIVVVIAAILFFFFNPLKNKEQTETAPVATQTQPVKQPAEYTETAERYSQPLNTAWPKDSETQSPSEYSNIVSDANGQVGERVMALLKDAADDIKTGRIIAARDTLNDVLNMPLTGELRNNIKKQMTLLAGDWLFDRTVLLGDGLCTTYKVQSGDILSAIAKRHKIPYEFIMRINNITNERALQVGQNIKVVNGPFHCIIYCSSFTMDLYLQNMYIKTYRVGLGKEGKNTPIGRWRTEIGGKLISPTWTDPDTGQTYNSNDPDYPLGSGWIGLEGTGPRTKGITGIALHGTKDETSIGTKSSRGCVRLFNGELIEVYNMMEPGESEVRTVE
ncbi:MAG: L,D-transpeptidase family protein [Anaerohalosphaeraceae bacterium]|nr:L,D-transpeptidase family protein [Anaerohalosphaeraceae bacterium]